MVERADYLVVGAGASAMAFIDVMLTESDATFVVVDKRRAPGGHWNDAYSFVKLHQPSAFYGVASRPLGEDRVVDTASGDRSLETATGFEIASYFHALMRDVFLPSGRVSYHPMSEYVGSNEYTSLLSGARYAVEAATLVDATFGGHGYSAHARAAVRGRRRCGVRPTERSAQLRRWLRQCRLNAPANMLHRAPEGDEAKRALTARVRDAFAPALSNARRLAAPFTPST